MNEAGGDTALVTGFPRQVARLVAAELHDAGTPVALLVRARHLEEARRFVARHEGQAPIEAIEGDVTSIDFGLGGREYVALAARVTEVHHAAVSSAEVAEARAAEHLNVQGARELLAFARESATARGLPPRVIYYGSVAVGRGAGECLREEPLDLARPAPDTVTASLRRAEAMLVRAWREVPTTIARTTPLVGHSRTGEVDVLDGVYLAVLLLLATPRDLGAPFPLREGTTLAVVPADHVARAGFALARAPGAAGRVVHLVDPAPPTARRAMELIAASVARRAPRGAIPVNVTRALLRTPGVDRLVRSPRSFAERLASRVRYEDTATRDLLPTGLRCPPFETYVDALVDHVRDRLARSPVDVAAPEPVDDPLF